MPDPDPKVPADHATFFELYLGVLTVSDPATGRIIKIKPDRTPDPETNMKSPYKFSFLQQDGYFNCFDVRELPNWTDRDLARDAEERIREAIDEGLLDVSG